MLVVKQALRKWQASGIPGISSCPLWNNLEGDGAYFANFIKDAFFPLHTHKGWEQIIVISGKIRFGDIILVAGDCLHVDTEDEHAAMALEDTIVFVAHRGGIDLK